MKALPLLCALLILPMMLFAQAPDTLWTRTYGPPTAQGVAVCETHDGGFVLVGHVASEQNYWRRLYVVRTDANGDTLWTRTSADDEYQEPIFVDVRPNGEIIIICQGHAMDYYYQVTFMRLNSIGDILDTKGYRAAEPDIDGYPVAACATVNGGYLIAAACGQPCMVYDLLTIKTDGLGDSVWQRQTEFGHHNDDYPAVVLDMPDGGALLMGSTSNYDGPTTFHNRFFLRYSASGDSLWSRMIDVSSYALSTSAVLAAYGSVLVAGRDGSSRPCLVRYDTLGNLMGVQSYGDDGTGRAGSVFQLPGNDLVWAGHAQATGDSTCDFRIGRCAPNGNLVWSQGYGTPRNDNFAEGKRTHDGGYILMGTTSVEGGTAMYAVRTAEDVSAAPPKPLLPSSFLLSVFPNPFNPSATISFALERAGHTTLAVFDVTGRQTRVVQDGFLGAGEHHFQFNGSALPTGLYFARLNAGSQMQTTKLLLLK